MDITLPSGNIAQINEVLTLNLAQLKLNSVNRINHGGCGISALSLLRFIEKEGIKLTDLTLVFMYKGFEEEVYIQNCQREQENNKKMGVPAHICLYAKELGYFDSTGNVTEDDIKDYFKIQHIRHDLQEFLLETINYPNGGENWKDNWNDCFKRINVRTIENILGIFLGEVIID